MGPRMGPVVRLVTPFPVERAEGRESHQRGWKCWEGGLRAGGRQALGSRLWAQALIAGSPGFQWGPGISGMGPALAAVAQGSPTRPLRTPSAGPLGSTSPSPVSPLGSLTTRGESGVPSLPWAHLLTWACLLSLQTPLNNLHPACCLAERPEGLGLTWCPGARKSGHSWLWAQC